jgi:hypothetical protein
VHGQLPRALAAADREVAGGRGEEIRRGQGHVRRRHKRPKGRLQVTNNVLALYAYVHAGPSQVLCDNVDRWFVVRV